MAGKNASVCIWINLYHGKAICDSGNFVTRDSTKQRENAPERAEQAVKIKYNAALVPIIPQPKKFATMWTLKLNSTVDADNTLNLVTRQSG